MKINLLFFLLILICNITGFISAKFKEKVMSIEEVEYMLADNNEQYIWLNKSLRSKILAIKNHLQSFCSCSKEFQDFCNHIELGATVASYNLTVQVLNECLKLIPSCNLKNKDKIYKLIKEYKSYLNTQDKLIVK